jgi:di/tricarboxylate transporter
VSWQAWLTLGVIAVVVWAMARDRVSPQVGLLSGVIVLLVAGVLTPEQAFQGFSNSAPITVAALFVLARAVEKSGLLQPVVSGVMGRDGSTRGALARLSVPVAAASAFLNNTPIVAMLVPQVTDWAERNGRSPSRYLMPLSFAAILGGVVTLIGTSTNLVVSGLLQAHGLEPLGMFEMTRLGLPVAVGGLALVILLAPVLLPERRAAREQATAGAREFSVQMRVVRGGTLDGKRVEEGGLRHLQGVYLIEIERDGQTIAPVPPDTELAAADRLTFVGRVDTVVDLQTMGGLTSAEEAHFLEFDGPRHTFFEAVVGGGSPLAGKTLKELEFRSRYQAAVVAIHRSGELVRAKLGQVRLRAGDALLLIADEAFLDRWRDRSDFLLVSRFGGTPPAVPRKRAIVGMVTVAIILGAAFGVLPILKLSLLGALVLVVSGALTPTEARHAVNIEVIVAIAAAFGLAAALDTSGLAHGLATVIVDTFGRLGPHGVLAGLLLLTLALTAVVTNNAAAALMLPVALSTAETFGLAVRPVVIAITVVASASFLTPIAYQTNLMVYGPGGYKFGDYARLGIPLTALVVAVVLALT